MKQTKGLKLVTCLLLLILMGVVTGCEKDAYNPDNGKLPPEENYFDFSLRGEATLNVDYDAPGMVAPIELFTENPMEIRSASYVKKKGIEPIFAAFTKDGKISTKFNVATATKELYLYTGRIGLPFCVKLTPDANGNYSYVDDTQGNSATTRAGVIFSGDLPYKVTGNNIDVYALYDWDANARPVKGSLVGLPKTITPDNFNALITRAQIFLEANKRDHDGKNENFALGGGKSNLVIPKGGSIVNVTYIGKWGAYPSVFGYYYYKKGSNPDVAKLKKYVLFPTTTSSTEPGMKNQGIDRGQTAELLYFDGETPSKTFPEGTVVGWFFIAKGSFATSGNGDKDGLYNISTIIPDGPDLNTSYSNNPKESCQFVSLYDKTTKALVVGVEDLFGNKLVQDFGPSDRDFDDLLFFVSTDPGLNEPGDLPEIDEKPEFTEYKIDGTVAFEDIWPKGGDYDLNDVIVEYHRVITVDKDNKAIKSVDTFKPVQPEKSALQDNFFACQYKEGTLAVPAGMTLETKTNSIVIAESARNISGQTYTITRDLAKSNMTQLEADNDFNPYIITKAYTTENRVEIHLPLKEMTTAADSKLMTEENAYYVSKDGAYPYAINIPITGFVPATETVRIDAEGQYPNFAEWTKSKGEEAKDWYKK